MGRNGKKQIQTKWLKLLRHFGWLNRLKSQYIVIK